MPPWGPVSRRNLIYYLREAGCTGPYAGKRHQFMRCYTRRVTIPNPHDGHIGEGLLKRVLDQAGISRTDWEQLS